MIKNYLTVRDLLRHYYHSTLNLMFCPATVSDEQSENPESRHGSDPSTDDIMSLNITHTIPFVRGRSKAH